MTVRTPSGSSSWPPLSARLPPPLTAGGDSAHHSLDILSAWQRLRSAGRRHAAVLTAAGVGVDVDERERIRVNARRVGLQAPAFSDEDGGAHGATTPTSTADVAADAASRPATPPDPATSPAASAVATEARLSELLGAVFPGPPSGPPPPTPPTPPPA
ncbi:hypothetical protein MMPV_001951 [Pyropia vietnamensis]